MADNCTDHPEWTDCWENWVQDYIDDNTYTIGWGRITVHPNDDKLAEYEEWSKEYCAGVVKCTYPDEASEEKCEGNEEFETCWGSASGQWIYDYRQDICGGTLCHPDPDDETELESWREDIEDKIAGCQADCADPSKHNCDLTDYNVTYCDLYDCADDFECAIWPDYCYADTDEGGDTAVEEAPPSGYEYWYLIYPNTSTIGITKNELISSDSFALKTGLYSAITADDNIWDAALLRTGVADATEQAIISGLDFDLDIDATLLSDPDIKGITPFKVATSVSEDAFVVGWAYGNTKRPKFTFDSSIDLSEIYNVAYRGDTFKSTFSRYDDGVSFQNKHEDFINKLAKSVGLADSSVSIRNFKKVKRNQIDYKKLSIFDDIDTSTTVSTTVATSVTTGGGY